MGFSCPPKLRLSWRSNIGKDVLLLHRWGWQSRLQTHPLVTWHSDSQGLQHISSRTCSHNHGQSPFLTWENSLCLWPFSILMLAYQRVYISLKLILGHHTLASSLSESHGNHVEEHQKPWWKTPVFHTLSPANMWCFCLISFHTTIFSRIELWMNNTTIWLVY